jgi:hypothetical protein
MRLRLFDRAVIWLAFFGAVGFLLDFLRLP